MPQDPGRAPPGQAAAFYDVLARFFRGRFALIVFHRVDRGLSAEGEVQAWVSQSPV